jgi:hypothetical protein
MMKKGGSAWIEVVVVAIYIATIGFPASTEAILIDFNDRASLSALCYRARDGTEVRGGRFTFVIGRPGPGSCRGSQIFNDAYVEDNMLFFNGVFPPDPALGPIPQPEYHLNYENPSLNENVQAWSTLSNPENEPRTLSPPSKGAVIQLTYDPNNDGIPDPFNLISIDVLSGKLNVG